MAEPKYELTDETSIVDRGATKVFRIRALRDFGEGAFEVKKGDLGGFIQSEVNLAHAGNAWVSERACIYNKALVSGNAQVFGRARVGHHAQVFDDAWVFGGAELSDFVKVFGNARVGGNARLLGYANVGADGWMTGDTPVFGMTDFLSRSKSELRPGREL